jgi:hypothetical protein
LSYQWTMLTAKTSMFPLQCIFLSKTCCSKNAEAAENGQVFSFLSVFQRSVTRPRVAHAAHQAIKNQGQSLLCACAHLSAF